MGKLGLMILSTAVAGAIMFGLSCHQQTGAGQQTHKQRITPIVENPTGTFYGDSYAFSGGGCSVATVNGRIPVVAVGGQNALKI
ncbi:hypothetical protein GG496_001011, partial [Candidatus Fervidibacteria bacterium JGI MDM2 JNZ-1-D12]